MAILLYATLLVISTLFYHFTSSWNLPTSIYYGCQIIFGEMMDVPHVTQLYVKFFTLILYIVGQGLLLSAFSTLYSLKIEDIKLSVTNKVYMNMLSNLAVSTSKIVSSSEQKLSPQTVLVVITLTWTLFGVIYAKFFEKMDLITSFYWSLSLISCSGDAPPVCEQSGDEQSGEAGPCNITHVRLIFMVVFITIGVPLFSVTLGSICTLRLLSEAYEYEENKRIENPFNDEEIKFALSLDSKRKQYFNFSGRNNHSEVDDDGIDASSFIVIELLRLKKITKDDITRYLSLFDKIDDGNKGVVTKASIDSYISKIGGVGDDSIVASGRGGYESINDVSESSKLHDSFNVLMRVASSRRRSSLMVSDGKP